MEILTWSRPTSPAGDLPVIISEYLLNERGIFVKREKRMLKKAKFTALTGFRIGYAAIPGTDYRAAPLDRNAILWHKITRIREAGSDGLIVSGNRQDTIALSFDPADRGTVMDYIDTMRNNIPPSERRIMTPPPGCAGGTMMTGAMIRTCPLSKWWRWKGIPNVLLNRRFLKKPGYPASGMVLFPTCRQPPRNDRHSAANAAPPWQRMTTSARNAASALTTDRAA